MKEISKDEYIEALQIVEAYHSKILNDANFIKKTLLKEVYLFDFLENCTYLSVKLNTILSEYFNFYGNVLLSSVIKQNFLKIRNSGIKSWQLFVEIREEYLTDKINR